MFEDRIVRGRPRVRAGIATAALAVALVAAAAVPADAAPAVAERRATVASYNLYLGADLQPLFGKSGSELVLAAAQVYAHVLQVDFPARARVIARNIVAHDADIVGLQEVALWQTAPLSATPQFQPTVDYLAILLDALEDAGVRYEAVVTNVNFGAALPISATTLASLSMRDVIIVRADTPASVMKTSNPSPHNFATELEVPIAGGTIAVPRGWSTIDVKFRGKWFRFANTHLEAFHPLVRAAQAQELAGALVASPYPVILTGDLNSVPSDATGSYAILQAAGFSDAWTDAMGADPGFTSGQPDDLDCTLPSTIDHRIDYVMYRGSSLAAVADSGEVIGEEPADCTTGTTPPLWPSDHAGVVVTMHIAAP